MILRRLRIALLGLGVVAGAVLPAHAQVPVTRDTVAGRRDTARTRVDTAGGRRNLPPAGRDTIRVPTPPKADSMIKNDSALKGLVPMPVVIRKDSIKTPLARAEAPPILEIGAPRIYDRTALFATGAVTMSDLLARVPGLTEYSTGFLEAPTLVASEGDFRRIRLFLDGLELDAMDRRARGVSPINDLPIHALEEVRIERGADEVRVYARTWRVDRTDPYTRADIATGDLNANLYRAFFGRRYDHGEALQVSAEQFTTQPDRRLPSSDALNLFARLGLTHGPWSADAVLERSRKDRAQWTGNGTASETLDTVPSLDARRTTSYLRLGNGDPERGRWAQVVASAHLYETSARQSTNLSSSTPSAADSLAKLTDTTSFESQYLFTGGMTRGPFKVSAAERIRIGDHRTSHVLSARASGVSGPLSVSLFGEGRSYMAPQRVEASARLSLLDRIALSGSASRTGEGILDRLFVEPNRNASYLDASGVFQPVPGVILGGRANDTSEVSRFEVAPRTSFRAEAGIRLRDLWLSAGVMRRGATTLLAPSEIDSVYANALSVRLEGEATAKTISARGRLFKAVYADAWAIAWDDSTGLYRPKYQTHSELYIQTNLLDRFPRGNFGLLTSLTHEYRSNSRFAYGDAIRVAPGYRVLSFKLEIRVQTATVSYQFRNLLQERYQQIPGFNLPRQTQFYGVRWDFWN